MLVDTHTHSRFSGDGVESVARLCEGAIQNGVTHLCVTDHFEAFELDHGGRDLVLKSMCAEVAEAAERYAGRVRLYRGVELGQALQEPGMWAKMTAICAFDFVLLAVHSNPGEPDFYFMGERAYTLDFDRIYTTYLLHLLDHARVCDYDSLAHLTYPLRYRIGRHGLPVDERRYEDLVDEILKTLIARGKALELNVSGLRQPFRRTMPGERILRRYRELGGELLTIGSDAHEGRFVGAGIRAGMAMARDAGFERAAYYVNREPQFFSLAD